MGGKMCTESIPHVHFRKFTYGYTWLKKIGCMRSNEGCGNSRFLFLICFFGEFQNRAQIFPIFQNRTKKKVGF